MPKTTDFLEEVGEVARELGSLGLKPVLVGGMALVILGSRRVTRDFDFVVSKPEESLEAMVGVFYDRGLELASRLNDNGEITATIDNRKVATVRLRLDAPSSAYFLNPKTSLRIDLLFDFPVPAAELAGEAKRTKIRSHVFHIASEHDLIRLKTMAVSRRSSPGDTEDLAFLKAREKRRQ